MTCFLKLLQHALRYYLHTVYFLLLKMHKYFKKGKRSILFYILRLFFATTGHLDEDLAIMLEMKEP